MNERTNYSHEPHREYRAGRTEWRTKCCNALEETAGSYGSFYKQCSVCHYSDINGLVPSVLVYYPSSFEEELESKIEALEKHMLSLAQSIEKLVDKLSGKDIPGRPGRY